MSAFPKYDCYKDSQVDSFGEIPAGWDVQPICAVSKPKSVRGCPDRELLSVYLDRGVIKFSDVDEKRTNATSTDLSNYQAVDPGDLVLNNQQAWRGSVGVSTHEGIVSPAYIILSLSDRWNPAYANYLFRDSAMVSQYLIYSKGVGTIQRNLYYPDFKRASVILPPKPEQDRIVTFLDRKTAEIDALIAKKQRQIELLDEQKAILINRAVTRGLNPNAKLKPSGIEWLPDYPATWRFTRIKALQSGAGVEVQIGPFGGMIKDLPSSPTGFKVYGQENTISGDLTKGSRWLEPSRYRALAEYRIQRNDVLLTRKGSIGNAFQVPNDFAPGIIDSDTIRVRLLSVELLVDYFLLLMKEAPFMNEQIFYTAKGAIIAGLNTQTIRNLRIPLPDPDEQREILSHVCTLKSKQGAARSKIESQIQSLKTLRSTLIAHAVTGRIKV